MKKLLALMVFALFAVAVQAQDSKDRDGYTASSAQVASQGFTYTHAAPSDTSTVHYFVLLFDTAPATVTIGVTPCTGTPTDATKVCGQPTSLLFSANWNPILPVYGAANYYLVSVTWTGLIGSASLSITGYVR